MKHQQEIDPLKDNDTTAKIKAAINNLREVEKVIFSVYIEEGTYTAVAKKYNVSVPTARTYIMKIKEKIKEEIGNDLDFDLD